MDNIRKATEKDLVRIAEIEIFNYRLYFYPIFKNDRFYFSHLSVPVLAEKYHKETDNLYVYDDGVIKGFARIENNEIKKLFVEPVLQNNKIGSCLLQYAVDNGAEYLWALEKNIKAISFYKKYGFSDTGEKKYEDGTTGYLIKLKK